MKKLFFALSALAALTLLAPSAGFAQTAFNQLGIYTDQAADPASANYTATVNLPFNAYLVLTNPVNHDFNGVSDTERPVTLVDGFEAKIVMPADATFFTLSEVFPAAEIDVGVKPDYVVGFSTSVPVTGNAVVLCTWQFMILAPSVYEIYLNITDIPSLPGVMAFVDNEDPLINLQAVYPANNNFDAPIFSINGDNVVAVETESWGNVKSLFR